MALSFNTEVTAEAATCSLPPPGQNFNGVVDMAWSGGMYISATVGGKRCCGVLLDATKVQELLTAGGEAAPAPTLVKLLAKLNPAPLPTFSWCQPEAVKDCPAPATPPVKKRQRSDASSDPMPRKVSPEVPLRRARSLSVPDPPPRDAGRKTVVVVGAGMAGLGAAITLQEMGMRVIVLEARERAGGRVVSEALGDGRTRVDTGASFIHGSTDNPVTELCEQLGLTLVELSDQNSPMFDFDGQLVATEDDHRAMHIFNTALGQSKPHGMAMARARVKTARKAVDSRVGGAAVDGGGGDGDPKTELEAIVASMSLEQVLKQLLEGKTNATEQESRLVAWYGSHASYANAARLSELSFFHWDQDDVHEYEGAHVMIKEGYGTLAKGLAMQLGDSSVRYRFEVSRVEYNPRRCCRVTGRSASSGEEEVIDCDFVIVAVPLGCLKHGTIEFDPPLPEYKQNAIERLGFGLLNKVFVRFPTPFWRKHVSPETRYMAYASDPAGRWYFSIDLVDTTGQPVILVFLVGDQAEEAETASDDEIVSDYVEVLRKMFPAADVPKPVVSLVTRWRSDVYARGSYSFVATGCDGTELDELADAVDERVFFAGEHTNRHHPASVHGAWESGVREALNVRQVMQGGQYQKLDIVMPEIGPMPANAACALCHVVGLKKSRRDNLEGPFYLGPGLHPAYVHEQCALGSPGVELDERGRWYEVATAVLRGRRMQCSVCSKPGATVGCRVGRCSFVVHVPCAVGLSPSVNNSDKHSRSVICPLHQSSNGIKSPRLAAAAAAAASGAVAGSRGTLTRSARLTPPPDSASAPDKGSPSQAAAASSNKKRKADDGEVSTPTTLRKAGTGVNTSTATTPVLSSQRMKLRVATAPSTRSKLGGMRLLDMSVQLPGGE